MCLAKAFLNQDRGEPLMQEIARLKSDGERVTLENLFGESRAITGRVREIDFMASRVILEGRLENAAGTA